MSLFGPLFPFELTRLVRRQRVIAGRCLYVTLLLVMLGLIYLVLFPQTPTSVMDYLFRSTANAKEMAEFGYLFFCFFALLQHVIGTFAVASMSSAILAEERERQTLPFLLTTTMTDREIVLGKLAARLAQTLMVLLAGLPVMAAMQVLGGIDPTLLWVAFAATGATLISAAGVGAWISIGAASAKIANGRTIGLWAMYLFSIPWAGFMLQQAYGNVLLLPPVLGGLTVGEFVDGVNAGNLFWAAGQVGRKLSASVPLNNVLPGMLFRYLLFHAVVSFLTIGWSSWRLRRTMNRQADKVSVKVDDSAGGVLFGNRRPVSQTRPVLWREACTAVGRFRTKRWHRWLKRGLYVASFLPLILVFFEYLGLSGERLASKVHDLVRSLGTMVLCGTLIHIANQSAASLGRDKRQKTFEELSLTDLTNREILSDKLLAAIWSGRWAVLWVGLHWLVDLFVRGLSLWTLVIVPPVFAVYVLFAARLGIWCATHETPRRKTGGLATLILLSMAGLPWILPMAHVTLARRGGDVGTTAAFAAGLSPPGALGLLTLSTNNVSRGFGAFRESEMIAFVAGLVVGMLICLFGAGTAWRRAKRRFAMDRRE